MAMFDDSEQVPSCAAVIACCKCNTAIVSAGSELRSVDLAPIWRRDMYVTAASLLQKMDVFVAIELSQNNFALHSVWPLLRDSLWRDAMKKRWYL